MPQRDYKQVKLNENKVSMIPTKYETGYNWIPDKFGPPPGIPRDEKEKLDKMSDIQYLRAVLRKSEAEIESLMVSEKERRRSFRPTWTYGSTVKGEDLAKAGFYCLSDEDTVKCAFCSVVLAQWKKEESPMERHKSKASFCSFVRGKAVNNIPFNIIGFGALPKLLKKKDPLDDAKGAGCMDSYHEKDADNEPDRVELKSPQRRAATFRNWPFEIQLFADAGFYRVTENSSVTACFYCGGTIEDWTAEDDPWEEHARWYYKCLYLLNSKGGDFIKDVRSNMTDQERLESENLIYSTNHEEPQGIAAVTHLEQYKRAQDLGTDTKILDKAFDSNEQFPSLNSLFRIAARNDDQADTEIDLADAIQNETAGELCDEEHFQFAVKFGFKEESVREAYAKLEGRKFETPYQLVKMIYRLHDEKEDRRQREREKIKRDLDLLDNLRAGELRRGNEIYKLRQEGRLTDEQLSELIQLKFCRICAMKITVGLVCIPCRCYMVCSWCTAKENPLAVKLPISCDSCDMQILYWRRKSF